MNPCILQSVTHSLYQHFCELNILLFFLSTHFIASQFPCLFFVKNLFIFFQCLWGLCWEPYGILCVRQRHIYSGIKKKQGNIVHKPAPNRISRSYWFTDLSTIERWTWFNCYNTKCTNLFFLSFNFLVITNKSHFISL